MNKTKKIAIAAVSLVMAGTLSVGVFGCTPKNNKPKGPELVATGHNVESVTDTSKVDTKTVSVGENKNVTFYTLKDTNVPVYTTSAALDMNICDGTNKDRHITYDATQIATNAVLPDGKTYRAGDLKPAWAQMSKDLGVNFNDNAQDRSSEVQITDMIKNNEQANYNIVTGSGNAITTNAEHFLDLSKFLDYMPNYKAFLDSNPIVKWSLTSNTETGAMYYAPYFDGNNDIEKYVLTHKEWTRVMLDGASVSAADTTWAQSKTGKANVGSEQTYAVGEMGKTGNYTVDTTDPADANKLVKLKVNYDDALDAAKAESSALGAAYKAAAGAVYAGDSGNIVDIMNAAIAATSGGVTGAQLLGILRAYIDVAYQTEAGAKFYATRSDVFNSVSAGWDIDLYTALSRCVVTSYKLFGNAAKTFNANQIYALAGRQGTTQRRQDLIAFVGELYGVRGLESRNEYAYVDANGELKDARLNNDTYDAFNKFANLTKEGLVYTADANAAKYASNGAILTFSLHDYSQTQTEDGFNLDVEGYKGKNNLAGFEYEGDLKFDFAPILTPVAKWDTNSDGTKETAMRFTESWRAVKNTGFTVPLASVESAPEKLSAVLAFIDYLFSNDGQIVATFGNMSSKGNVSDADGFWYGENAIDLIGEDGTVKSDYADIVESYDGIQCIVKQAYKGQYFSYGNKLYKGTNYLGTQVPKLTTNNLTYFYGKEVNGHYMTEGTTANGGLGFVSNYAGNYTNYCRGVVGGALPIGNKNQGFEYQATASCALRGADIVSQALVNGAIKHLTQEVSADSYWYTCVPTTLPINSTDATTIKNQQDIAGAKATGGLFWNNSDKTFVTNLPLDIMFYGYGADVNVAGNAQSKYGKVPADAAAAVTLVNQYGMSTRASIYAKGWTALKTAFMG